MRSLPTVVHAAFHRPETRLYRIVQGLVWILIAVSVALLAAEFVPGRGRVERELPPWLATLDRAILWVFAVEILLRVASYHPPALDLFGGSRWRRLGLHLRGRLRFALRPMSLVDILTVAALVPALRGLRALRLLRLLRTAGLFRYSNPFQGLARAFRDNAFLYGFAFSLLATAVLLGGVSIYLVEVGKNPTIQNLGHGIWWALVTLTTVGFGDITPATGLGRVVGGVLMVSGLFTLALFAGIVGNTLLNAVLSVREEQFRMSGYVNHVVVCGFDPGARRLLDALLEELDPERTPLVVFACGERPGDLPPELVWVDGDPTKESELGKVRLTHASSAVLVGSRTLPPQQADAATILTAFTLRSYLAKQEKGRLRRRPLYVVAEILDAENVEHARAAGADEVIETTRLGFSLLAHAVAMPGTAAIMSRVATSGAHSLFVGAPPPSDDGPVRFGELARRLKAERDALLIGVRDPDTGKDRLNPPDDLEITGELELIYLAEQEVLAARSEEPETPGRQPA